jgi:hypothetical protein
MRHPVGHRSEKPAGVKAPRTSERDSSQRCTVRVAFSDAVRSVTRGRPFFRSAFFVLRGEICSITIDSRVNITPTLRMTPTL